MLCRLQVVRRSCAAVSTEHELRPAGEPERDAHRAPRCRSRCRPVERGQSVRCLGQQNAAVTYDGFDGVREGVAGRAPAGSPWSGDLGRRSAQP
jgi:hypothetical protein